MATASRLTSKRLDLDDVAFAAVTTGFLLALFISSSTASAALRAFSSLLLLTGAALQALAAAKRRQLPALWRSPLAAGSLGLLALAWWLSPFEFSSTERAVTWAAYAAGGAALAALVGKASRRTTLVASLIAAACLLSLHGIAERSYLFDLLRPEKNPLDAWFRPLEVQAFFSSNRARSTFGQANAFAGFLVVLLPLAIFAAAERRGRAAGLVLLSLVIGGLIASGSKGGAWCALLVGGLALRRLEKEGRPQPVPSHLALGIAILGTLLIIVTVAGYETSLPLDPVLDTLRLRRDYWSTALAMWRANPATGVGLGFFGECYTLYAAPGVAFSRFAHNGFLTLVAETGSVGVAFLALFGWCYTRGPGPPEAGSEAETPGVRGVLLPLGALAIASIEPAVRFTSGGRLETLSLTGAALALLFVFVGRPVATRIAVATPGARHAARLGTAGFLVHSLVDFDFYTYGVLAAVVATNSVAGQSRAPRRHSPIIGLSTCAVFLLVAALWLLPVQRTAPMEAWVRASGYGWDSPYVPPPLEAAESTPVHLRALLRAVQRSHPPEVTRRLRTIFEHHEAELGHVPRFAHTLEALRRD